DSSHADYYLEKHGGILTEFEIEDDLWAAIQTRRDKRKTGNEEYDKLTVTACTDPKVPNKENALYLANGWITYLKKNVKGRATVYRPAEDTSKLKGTDMVWAYTEEDGVADHENAVELSLSEAEAGGWQVMTIAEAKRRGFWHE
ncbi:MAG TPA: hypothetical protein VFR03_16405, partial [Thermoanaerobaculia bacterium]|nr:hypothetical protein [Thermoanaerobaculia bacterium]